eukprot:m.311945 g.311945  ORF g.311945 m.311945 type:complete len:98 (+) comp15963_c0_seq6:486-779(+)
MQDLLNLMSKTVAPPVNIRTLVIGSIGSLCASEVVPYMVHTYKSYGDLLVSLGEVVSFVFDQHCSVVLPQRVPWTSVLTRMESDGAHERTYVRLCDV